MLPLCACSCLLPAYLLGRDGGHWKLAVDVDADTLPEFLSEGYPEALDLRTLMSELPADQLAIAGHAAALSQWHTARNPCMHAIHACTQSMHARMHARLRLQCGKCWWLSGPYPHLSCMHVDTIFVCKSTAWR